MTGHEWRRIKAIAGDAWLRPPAERASYAADACADDEDLRREVLSLLSSMGEAEDHFDDRTALAAQSTAATAAALGSSAWIGRRLGAYQILRELGSGGMGRVFLAARADGQFEKQVAIKIMRWTADADVLAERFKQEREILAALEHPNIARLIDAGATEEAVPYVVMEYVEGVTIDAYCDRHALTTAARLTLVRDVCDAVDHAHRRQVVHRDLKAGNILVTADGTPKLLDFGIAKLAGAAAGERDRTQTGMRVLTPDSAAPEQVQGGAITPATDVYALGMLLYRLLTGKRPYDVQLGDLATVICETEPPSPSAIAQRADVDTAVLRKELSGDIDSIVGKALRKEPERRYSSAAQFAEDIGRHLQGLPVLAVPDTIGSRANRFVWRRRSGVAVTVLAAAVVTVAAVFVSGSWRTPTSPAPADEMRSIAILPFLELGNPSNDSRLGWGMADALLMRLSRIEPLQMRSLGAVLDLGDAGHRDPATAGTRLRADGVIEGSIQQDAGRVRLTARLFDVRSNSTVWSDTVEDAGGDMFRLQDDLAIDIARRLAPRIDPAGLRVKSRTTSAAAYEAYVNGRYYLNQRTANDIRQAIVYFEQAIATDPLFAPAHSGLADAYGVLPDFVPSSSEDAGARARTAAHRAVELDDSLAEAHASLAWNLLVFEFNWPAAEPEFRRALTLNPGYTTASAWYAAGLASQRRFEEAIQHLRGARNRDPLSRPLLTQLVRVLYLARRYDESIHEVDLALPTDPRMERLRMMRGLARLQLGQADAALEDLRAAAGAPGETVNELAALGFALGHLGRTAEARTILKQVESRVAAGQASAYFAAEVYAGLGDAERTIEYLTRARTQAYPIILRVASDPAFDLIHGDVRLQALMAPREPHR